MKLSNMKWAGVSKEVAGEIESSGSNECVGLETLVLWPKIVGRKEFNLQELYILSD